MTRNEAIAVWRTNALAKAEADFRRRMSGDIVDEMVGRMAADDVAGFVALGMLKLDEPQSDDGEVARRLLNACHGVPYLATFINETLAKANLKIIEAPEVSDDR